MNISRTLLAFAAPVALLAVSGCAEPFNARVARFQRLPAPQGQTFRIVPVNPRDRGGLEFGTYAAQVAQRLAQQGYRPSMDAAGAATDMVVQLDYGVGPGREKVTTTPGFNCGFGGFGGYRGYGGFGGGFGGFGGGFGGFGGGGWRYGWGGPFGGFGGGFGCPDVESYTVYSSYLTMSITRADGAKLFEGRARAHSTTDDLTSLVPNLIDAMFRGFPGNSGQDIRISISPKEQKQRMQAASPPQPVGGPTS